MTEPKPTSQNSPDFNMPPGANELSRQRINQLSSVVENLQTTMPELIGMTVYGSVARGQAREDSDVDICMFIEPSDDPTSPQNNPALTVEGGKIHYKEELPSTPVFKGPIDMDYKVLTQSELGRNGITKSDIDVLPINKEILDGAIGTYIKDTEAFARNETDTYKVPRTIRALFHQPVGPASRLQPYIEHVIHGLSEQAEPETAQLAWTTLRHMVIGFEKGRDNDPKQFNRDLPEAFADAQLKYTSNPTT